jgi:thiol:disulfide interchange protein DsbC
MRRIICIVAVMMFVFAGQACSASEVTHDTKAHDCAQCHKLSNDEAAALLKDGIPNVKVLNVAPAPVKGLWEVLLQSGRNKGIVYIDYSKKNFVSGGIFDIKGKTNLSKERFEELNKKYADSDKVDASKIPLDDALVMGDSGAKYRVIVFTDPDCPYCGKMHAEIKKVLDKRKDIVFFVKMFPLPMHPEAEWKSKSMICKKSVQMLDDNFAGKKIEKADCKTTAVEDNKKLAAELGISGTPAMVLQDGRVMPGYRDADSLIKLIVN